MKSKELSHQDLLVKDSYNLLDEVRWPDTDGDGIPDVVEIYLSNRSTWSKLEDFNSTLWQKYSWISDYYNTIVSKENESAANEWLKSQFNPLIKDHTPPVITKFTIKWVVKYSVNWTPVQVYAKVHLIVRDVGGISYLDVIDQDSGEDYSPDTGGATVYELTHKFSATILQAGVGSVSIGVMADDSAHNYIAVSKTLKGALGQVLDALGSVWHELWQRLQSAARQVAAGLSVLEQYIIGIVKDTIERIFSPLLNFIHRWETESLETVNGSYLYYKEHGTLNSYWKERLKEMIFGTGFYICLGIGIGMVALMYLISALTMGSGGLVMDIVVPIIVGVVVTLVMNVAYEKGYKLPFNVPNKLSLDVIKNIIKSLYEGKSKTTLYEAYTKNDEYDRDLIISYLGDIIGLSGIIITLYMAAQQEPTGSLLTGLVVGLGVWALPYYVIALLMPTAKPVQLIFGGIGLIFSLPSVLSIVEFSTQKTYSLKGCF